jgi:16S rRNA (guanine966-N2)-methyltransferase
VREALFNILGDAIVGEAFVDLAAGTGAVGLEALSRGAEPVVLVERERAALAVLRKNVALVTGGEADGERLRVVAQDVGRFLDKADSPKPAAVVYLDLPYGDRRIGRFMAALAGRGWLDEESLLVVEHRKGEPPDPVQGLEELWSRRYADVVLRAFGLG